MDYLACKISFVTIETAVLTYRCGADVTVRSLNIASVVDYAEMKYHDLYDMIRYMIRYNMIYLTAIG